MPSPQPSRPVILAGVGLLVIIGIAAGLSWYDAPAPLLPAPPTVAATPPAPVAAPPPVAPDHSSQVLALFNPSDQLLTQQHSESSRTQQIEEVLTLSFVLARCELISNLEYRDSFRALIVHAQRIGLAADARTAEARLRQMAESAGASYSLVYSRTDCGSAKLPELRRQLLVWQAGMLTDR